MAFAGLNVTFGFIQMSGTALQAIAPIYGPASASENMAGAGTSAAAAVAPNNPGLAVMASIYAAADSWVTIGATPADPSLAAPTGGKRFIPATTPIDVFCSPGDKVRWSLA